MIVLFNTTVTSVTAWHWYSSYRLCRSLVFLKVKAAELLLASTLVNIAGNVDSNAAICRLISTKVCRIPKLFNTLQLQSRVSLSDLIIFNVQVEKIIFSDSNHSLKSIHLFLDALNVIRSFYVAEKASTFPSNTLKVCYCCCFLLKWHDVLRISLKWSISYTVTNWKTGRLIEYLITAPVDLYQLDLLLILLTPLSQGGLMDHCYSSHETLCPQNVMFMITWNCDQFWVLVNFGQPLLILFSSDPLC